MSYAKQKSKGPSSLKWTSGRLFESNFAWSVAANGDGVVINFQRWIKIYSITVPVNTSVASFENFVNEVSSFSYVGGALNFLVNNPVTPGFSGGAGGQIIVFKKPWVVRMLRTLNAGGAGTRVMNIWYR